MVPIQISGHGVEVTEALRDFIEKKFHRVSRHSHTITTIHVFLHVNKLLHKAEATVHIPGHEIYASSESEDMYKNIDFLVDKLIRQLDKYREKEKQHQ